MHEILLDYQPPPPTTWVYFSAILIVAVYFKFGRVWSIRNLDLLCLILLSPGLLMVTEYGRAVGNAAVEHAGYVWLFSVGVIFLIRLLADSMTFLGLALFLFLMANVVTGPVNADDLKGPALADALRHRQEADLDQNTIDMHGPGYPPLFLLPNFVTQSLVPGQGALREGDPNPAYIAAARAMAILSHLAIVIGIIAIGYRHFDNMRTGIAAASLYLMLPYSAVLTGHVDHALPAALLVWAVEGYRRPLFSGVLLGLAIGTVFYPVFLLPLWISFYWQRGLWRFVLGVAAMIAVLAGTLAFTSADWAMFVAQLKQMFGWRTPIMENLGGFWQFETIDPVFRLPVLAAFFALCASMAFWPAQKNLGTLMSGSAVVMLGVQFWHAYGDGGLYMAWYLPMLLLTVFRPNLEDRVALYVLGEGWMPKWHVRWQMLRRAA